MKFSYGRRGFVVGALAALALTMLSGSQNSAYAQGKKVKLSVQFIEASTKTNTFDPKIARFKNNLAPYTGAKVVDQIVRQVDVGSSVSVQFLGGPKTLTITVESVDPKTGTIRLRHQIKSLKFDMRTKHEKKNATLLVRTPPQQSDKAIFLAVTPS